MATERSPERLADIDVLVKMNTVIQGWLTTLDDDEYYRLFNAFNRNKIVLGGESCCLHIEDEDGIDDCNPFTALGLLDLLTPYPRKEENGKKD